MLHSANESLLAIVNLRINTVSSVFLLVGARRGFTANRAGHSSGCELRQKGEPCIATGKVLPLQKLACYLARSLFFSDALPTSVCYHSSRALSSLSQYSSSYQPG